MKHTLLPSMVMGALDRIVMQSEQSCVIAEKFDIKQDNLYDAAIISEWSYKNLPGP
jgi:hypothetical protein